MRCKKHPIDLTSTVGVCATCLRERLFALIAAQAQAEAQAQAQLQAAENRFHSRTRTHTHTHTQTQPPPLLFPRSVSPYVTRRKSADPDSWAPDSQNRRFYSTPQIGPKFGEFSNYGDYSKKKHGKFSLIKNFFRSRSRQFDPDLAPDPDPRVSSHPDRNSHRDPTEASASSSSPSWFPFLPRRSKKESRPSVDGFSSYAHGGRSRKPSRISNRGMSPERGDEPEDDCGYDHSPTASGYSSSAAGVTPAHVRRMARGGHTRNVSGLAFCLSPLVRASPSRLHHQKSDIGFSGELRNPAKPHLSTASFCGNRSRKLVDFGRANNHNH